MALRIQLVGGPTAVIDVDGLRLVTDPTFDPPGSYQRPGGPELVKLAAPALTSHRPFDLLLDFLQTLGGWSRRRLRLFFGGLGLLFVLARATAAPSAAPPPAPPGGWALLLGRRPGFFFLLRDGWLAALAGEDRIDQVSFAQATIAVDRKLGCQSVKVGQGTCGERVAVQDRHGVPPRG